MCRYIIEGDPPIEVWVYTKYNQLQISTRGTRLNLKIDSIPKDEDEAVNFVCNALKEKKIECNYTHRNCFPKYHSFDDHRFVALAAVKILNGVLEGKLKQKELNVDS